MAEVLTLNMLIYKKIPMEVELDVYPPPTTADMKCINNYDALHMYLETLATII